MPIRLPGVTIDIFGKYVTLNSMSGLILHFDGRSSFIIELPSHLDGLIDGMCCLVLFMNKMVCFFVF